MSNTKFDIKPFRSNKKTLQYRLNRTVGLTEDRAMTIASEISAYSQAHLIAMFCYLGEIMGFSEKILDRLEYFKKEYGITEIVGIENKKE